MLAAYGLLFPGEAVLAHANLIRAEPPPSSVLAEPPNRVSLWFTEPIEPGFSEIQVLDTLGRRVDNRDSVVDRQNPTAMLVTLPVLPNGTYTVAWKNLSAVDGHTIRGSFAFSVGEPLNEIPRVGTPEQPLLESPMEPVLRWLALLGILAVVGGLGFELLVTRPVLLRPRASERLRQVGRQLAYRTLKLLWAGMGLFLVASVGQLLVQTSVVHALPLHKTLGSPLASILNGTDWGNLWLWRMGLLLAMAVVMGLALATSFRPLMDQRFLQGAIRTLALALGGGVLLTLSLVSHGAATGEIRTAALFSDYLHLLAAGFWVGGLFHFALGAPLLKKALVPAERRPVFSAMVPRFSVLATFSVGTLIITGLYSGWAQVTTLSAVATPYGLTLLGKIGLIAPLLLLGALNLLWVRPRLATEARSGQWLRWFVTVEAILAALVLLSVGLLTSLEPARQVASRQMATQEKKLTFRDTAEGVNITLEVGPGEVGLNKVEVSLADLRGSPITNTSDVSLRLKYLNADLGESPATATPIGQGKYILERVLLTVAGPWQAELVVRRPDAFDARTAFRFEVTSRAGIPSAAITPQPRVSKLLWGVELVLLGFLFVGVSVPLGEWRTVTGAGAMGLGIGAVLTGLFLLVTIQLTWPSTLETLRPSNPFPPNPESLNIGRQRYQQDCQSCHGVTGLGDGPLGAGLKPPPLNLRVHVPLHAEGDVFRFIRDGVWGTAMQPWGQKLTDEEIWHIVNYLKTFGESTVR
jgi:copper transport protein